MIEREPQIPLSLRFETSNLWHDFRHELGGSETCAAMILALCDANDWVSYSRATGHYALPRRYRDPLYTYQAVVGAADYLDEAGLIHHEKAKPGTRGWQSAVKATPELRSICARIIGGRKPRLTARGEVICLRDDHKKLVDYRDNRETDKMRRNMALINAAVTSIDLDGRPPPPMQRIFNKTMKRGGRFYAMGNSWQNIKSQARRSLTIDGEAVVELDFKNLHPAILYAEAGAEMHGDCYAIDGWPRKLVKVAMLTLINAKTKAAARLSIAHSPAMAETAPMSDQEALRHADVLIDAYQGEACPHCTRVSF